MHAERIPPGFCQCGCGERTRPARQTYGHRGIRKGDPMPYVQGHNRRKGPDDYVVDANGCWVWQRATQRNGYGKAWDGQRLALAHRVYYELHKGPIPEGLHLDHLCRNRACCNPEHLEPVTVAENNRRSAPERGANGRFVQELLR